MSILSTDLVYGSDPTHLVHYMHQCAMAGQIPRPFLSEAAKFMPALTAQLEKGRDLAYARCRAGRREEQLTNAAAAQSPKGRSSTGFKPS